MTNKRKTSSVSATMDSRDLEIETLKKQLQEAERGKEEKIPLDDLISVMSLIPHVLNLSTHGRGQGKVIKFDRFGQVKRILYKDLIDILETSRRFMEAGYFIILDKRVIKAHGLDEAYSKIITKEKIEDILSGSQDCTELYLSSNSLQQDIIVSMLVEKLRDAPDSVDLNMVDKISRISGINITEKASDARFILRKDSGEEG